MQKTKEKNLRDLDKYFQSRGFLQRIFLFCALIAASAGAIINLKQGFYLFFYLLIAVFFLLSSKMGRGSLKSDNYFWVKDICFGSGKIDHVCIGPTGIFAIETNDYSGKAYYYEGHLLMDGRKKGRDLIKEAKEDSSFLSDLIFEKLGKRYYVVPLVILPNARIERSVKDKKDGIWIGDEAFQDYIIKSGNYSISKDEVSKILDFLIKEKEKSSDDTKE